MDRAPDSLDRIGARLIAMAVSLIGDADKVRAHLACSAEDFQAYCAAGKILSPAQFDDLVGLIIREQGNLIAANRALLEKIRAKAATFSKKTD